MFSADLARAFLALLALAQPASLAAPRASLHVDAGALTPAIAAALAAEHGADRIASSAAGADLILTVSSTLSVRISTRAGAVLLDRAVPADRGPDPTVRLIVLLAGEALAAYETPPGGPIPATPIPAAIPEAPAPAPPPPPTAPRAFVSLGLLGMVWQHPGAVHAGFWAAADVNLDPLRAGLRAELAGVPCCRLDTSEAEGDALIARALAGGAFELVRADRVSLSVTAALGVEVISVDTVVLGFAGPSPVQTEAAISPFARAGAALAFSLAEGDRVRIVAAGGIEVRPARISIFLPTGYGDGSPVFDAGPITPALLLGLELGL